MEQNKILSNSYLILFWHDFFPFMVKIDNTHKALWYLTNIKPYFIIKRSFTNMLFYFVVFIILSLKDYQNIFFKLKWP
jgi:hypothetical protein